MDHLEVDSEVTRTQNADVRARADQLARSVRRLERGLEAMGRCWGHSDEVARSFEQTYVPSSQSIIRSCWDLIRGIEGTADGVDQAMKGLTHVEQGNSRLAAGPGPAPDGPTAAPPA